MRSHFDILNSHFALWHLLFVKAKTCFILVLVIKVLILVNP